MGLKCSSDIAQSMMEIVLAGIDDADVYIDDVGAFLHTWDDHVKLLSNILRSLRKNGFSINPLKREWAVKETDWLGLKPRNKKVDAILHMDHLRNATEICMFLGCINYY
ncbi:hypothetical protein ACHAW6_002640 [Cyclotella cf. meneghiniana]